MNSNYRLRIKRTKNNRNKRKCWLIRVGDGKNFRNSKLPIWCVKRGKGGNIKTVVKKLNKGDLLCFIVPKKYGGIVIGMAEYHEFYDRNDEPLIKINTLTNKELGWEGDTEWDIQIHYRNLYITERLNISCCISCPGIILNYETFKDRINDNLYDHYKNYKKYGEPKVFDDDE